MQHHRIVILGSGPAGMTAAVYAARANCQPVVIAGSALGGQLMTTTDVDNWSGDPMGLTGPDLMARMQQHVEQLNVPIIHDTIISVDTKARPFVLQGLEQQYTAEAIIIATGATAKYLGLPSEQLYRGKGVSACATCDGFFYRNKPVAVVGGGNVAVEEALYLSNMCSSVYLIHRRNTLRAERMLQDKLFAKMDAGKIIPVWNHVVQEVQGDDHGVTQLVLEDAQSGVRQQLQVDGLFVAIGHTPNSQLFEGQLQMNESGFLSVRSGQHGMATQTSVEGIFAAGDVADWTYRQAITSAGTGCMAALDAERYLDQS